MYDRIGSILTGKPIGYSMLPCLFAYFLFKCILFPSYLAKYISIYLYDSPVCQPICRVYSNPPDLSDHVQPFHRNAQASYIPAWLSPTRFRIAANHLLLQPEETRQVRSMAEQGQAERTRLQKLRGEFDSRQKPTTTDTYLGRLEPIFREAFSN